MNIENEYSAAGVIDNIRLQVPTSVGVCMKQPGGHLLEVTSRSELTAEDASSLTRASEKHH